jgi:flagellar protein FlaG
MDNITALSGQRSELVTLPVRAPVVVPTEGAVVPLGPESKPQAPLPPKVSYDPAKMRENLQAAVDHLNKQLASSGRSLGFSMDEVINRPVVTVRSTQTGEVIRQIPSEAVIRVAHTLDELKGLLHDAVG